ncbi:MAG: hypothetical protein JJE04_22145 [Acidobacteriia bacterium]|nr:hypothetical protein [Terriglobia bacterium]
MAQLRSGFDEAGADQKVIVIAGDGSFCNRTVFAGIPNRVELIARTRKDSKLCLPRTRRLALLLQQGKVHSRTGASR